GLHDSSEHIVHALAWNERAATKNVPGRRQKRGGWPAAEAVSLADVGSVVGIDPDRHESIVDECRDFGIGVARTVHFAARTTPRPGNRQQDGFVLGSRTRERDVAPRLPGDAGR